MPPVRNKVDIEKYVKKKEEAQAAKSNDIFCESDAKVNTKKMQNQAKDKEEGETKRDITPMFDYYKAWDKFAEEAEKEVDKNSDQSDEEADPETGFIPAKNP